MIPVGCLQNRRSARMKLTPESVGRVWANCLHQQPKPVINKDIHTYPQLIPTLGVLGWGELFNI